ncbi:Clp protease N-terminal domain-containing protein [Paeniglutamicibacter cryotolerans]|uniref:ATP-dependent Clp protease ATP-binding subunit ClpA n=1 Tax=Paeniglutamicibacter cryotolerans TaxID=670079 RepID=A0A839QYP3_9MICC|nr:Clp protease N-terminal domain-containing protein [Paeniglutamicibacter cryotolerans]MBB2997081.1 ATP-dependent Clp protease ATP-binding subunit ClpA [Paeniglutamicibacter cryotolerans]
MFERLTDAARDAVSASAAEANLRGDRRVGTDALLLGLLHDPAVASALGLNLATARAESAALDTRALAAIGVDTGGFAPTAPPAGSWRTPFTSGARAVISRALALAGQQKARAIGSKHLLLALLEAEPPDPAAALLTGAGIQRESARSAANAL